MMRKVMFENSEDEICLKFGCSKTEKENAEWHSVCVSNADFVT